MRKLLLLILVLILISFQVSAQESCWTFDTADQDGSQHTDVREGRDTITNICTNGVTGKLGEAVDCESSNSEYLSVASDSALDLGTPFTIKAWVNIESLVNGFIYNKRTGNAAADISAHMGISSSNFDCSVRDGGGGKSATSPTNPALGKWYHVVCAGNSTHIALYVNGVLNASTAITPPIEADVGSDLYFSAYNGPPIDNFYDGKTDDLYVNNGVAWATNESATDYNGGVGLTCKPPFDIAREFIFFDSGDRTYNGSAIIYNNNNDAISTTGWIDVGTVNYGNDEVFLGNMSIETEVSSSVNPIFGFGVDYQNVTIQYSFYDDSSDTTANFFMQHRTLTGTFGADMGVQTGVSSTEYYYNIGGGPTNQLSGITRTTDWHNFTFFVAPGGAYAATYIDGILMNNDTTSIVDIGQARFTTFGGAEALTGYLDDVQVWSGAPEDIPVAEVVEVSDTTDPIITNVTLSNTSFTIGDSIQVNATCTDDTGVETVYLADNRTGVFANFSNQTYANESLVIAIFNDTAQLGTIQYQATCEDASNNSDQTSIGSGVEILDDFFIVGDTYGVSSGGASADQNHGTEVSVLIASGANPSANNARGYWLINLSNVTGTIISANLTVNQDNYHNEGAPDPNLQWFYGNDDFDELNMTWNTQPCGTTLDTTAGTCNATILHNDTWSTFSVTNTNHTFSFTERALWELENDDGAFLLMARADDESKATLFQLGWDSKEDTDAGRNPRFFVEIFAEENTYTGSPIPTVEQLNITQINITSDGVTTILDIPNSINRTQNNSVKTTDPTPTFTVITDSLATCAIIDNNLDLNYSDIIKGNTSRECATTGTTTHICTLNSNDSIIGFGIHNFSIGCKQPDESETLNSTSGKFQVNLTVGASVKHVNITPDPIRELENATGDYTFFDADNGADLSLLEWTVNGTPITEAINQSILTYNNYTFGDLIEFCVTPYDGDFLGIQNCSGNVSIQDSTPSVQNVNFTPQPINELEDATGSYLFIDPANETNNSLLEWYVDGLAIPSAENLSTITASNYAVNQSLQFCITPYNNFLTGAQNCSNNVTVDEVDVSENFCTGVNSLFFFPNTSKFNFSTFTITDSNIFANGTNLTQCLYNITTSFGTTLNVSFTVNDTFLNFNMACGEGNNLTNSKVLNTTVYPGLINSTKDLNVWCWGNYINASSTQDFDLIIDFTVA